MDLPRYLILDIENDSSKRYKRKAGNFMYDKIVVIGMKEADEEPVVTEDIGQLGWRLARDPGIQVIVGHNLKHDLLFLWKYEFLQTWLRKGGRIWDTAQVDYILSGQERQYPALREIAVEHYGLPEREKVMEKYWDRGLQTSEIPIEEVKHDCHQDVRDTEILYLSQCKQVLSRNMGQLVAAENTTLLITTEMEFVGMKIDLEVLKKNKLELELRLEEEKTKLDLIIKEVWK